MDIPEYLPPTLVRRKNCLPLKLVPGVRSFGGLHCSRRGVGREISNNTNNNINGKVIVWYGKRERCWKGNINGDGDEGVVCLCVCGREMVTVVSRVVQLSTPDLEVWT